MTRSAGIGDFIFVGHRRGNEGKGVRAHFDVRDGRGDFRHVAGDATAARGAFLVMGMIFESRGARAIHGERRVALQTELVGGLAKLRVVFGAVHVVAAKTGDSAAVHDALHKIISLHAIFMGGAVGVMRKGRLAKRVLPELPEILQI